MGVFSESPFYQHQGRFLFPTICLWSRKGNFWTARTVNSSNSPPSRCKPNKYGAFRRFRAGFYATDGETGIQYATTGTVNPQSVLTETTMGMLNPMKTVERAGDLKRAVSGGGRLARDARVDPRAPTALPTDRPIGRSPTQNAAAQKEVRRMQDEGYTDIRVNQHQVDASGQRVGINRPDVQGTSPSGTREHVEFDTSKSNRGARHEQRIRSNDSEAKIDLRRVD